MATKRRRAATKPKAKRGRGQPTKFNESILKEIVYLAAQGKTIEEIATTLKVSSRVIYFWQKQHEEYFQTLKIARELPDNMVEASLFQRAIGFTQETPMERIVFGEKIKWTQRQYFPPDPVACFFWLKNRRPANWKDKLEVGPATDVELNLKIGHEDDAIDTTATHVEENGQPKLVASSADQAAKADTGKPGEI
jgi:hypothetical protein